MIGNYCAGEKSEMDELEKNYLGENISDEGAGGNQSVGAKDSDGK